MKTLGCRPRGSLQFPRHYVCPVLGSPKSHWLGFVGACLRGTGVIQRAPSLASGILLRVLNLRWGYTDPEGAAQAPPWVIWTDTCPCAGQTHSDTCSFKCCFLSIYCVPSTVLDTKDNTRNPAITAGGPWRLSAGPPPTHTHSGAPRTAPQERWCLSETWRLSRCWAGGEGGECS